MELNAVSPAVRRRPAARLLTGALTGAVLLAVPALALLWLAPGTLAFAAESPIPGLAALDAPAVNHDVQVARQEATSVAAQEALAGDEPVTVLDDWQDTAHHHHHKHHHRTPTSLTNAATTTGGPSIIINTTGGPGLTFSTPGGGIPNLVILNVTTGNITLTEIVFDNIFISIIVINPSASPCC
jgi:hypothetical protein